METNIQCQTGQLQKATHEDIYDTTPVVRVQGTLWKRNKKILRVRRHRNVLGDHVFQMQPCSINNILTKQDCKESNTNRYANVQGRNHTGLHP